ncbi:MAG: sigma-54 dependent transcriptional regulator [Planctomycetota bacterium]
MRVNRGELERDPSSAPSGRPAGAPRAPDPFVGHSPALADFLERVGRAAASESTVLVLGESGTGKSRAAERLHRLSPRSAGPFVAASLVATSATLIESTLFGHERGAFTDAHKTRQGIFRRAHGGTVLLDGIDHLPLEAQVKLLRVLQERTVEPLGGEGSIAVDVRVVATASTPLERLVEAGTFRADLFYRLAVLTLEVPPLRRRAEDLESLVAELSACVAERVGVPARPFSADALAALRAHPWPGNVRELENALERVLVLGGEAGEPTREIQGEELAFLGQAREGAASELARAALALGLTVDTLTRAMMERALEEQRGNVSAAARTVGLTRRAFDYRMAHPDAENGA